MIGSKEELLSFPWHPVDKLLFDEFVCSDRVKRSGSYAKQDIRIAQKLRILHLQFHVLDELLVGGHLVHDKLNVFAITLQSTADINLAAI